MYEPSADRIANLAFLWPAFIAASMSEITARTARQFADLAVGPDAPAGSELRWATANTIALDLKTVRLRDFSTKANGSPILLCAPLASHSAAIVDLAPGHSLVAALLRNGVKRLFVTDWRSATVEMRLHGIDDYLADLNVLVDEIGGPVDLIGLCQGGWMALVYAARFPEKVRKLVVAGAPIDVSAARSALSTLADTSPLAVFHGLLRIGEGLVPGRKVMRFWGVESVTVEDLRQVLQTDEVAGSTAFRRLEAAFRDWYSWTLDLPATYFLEVVEKLYKRNELAVGSFVALGKTIDLATVTAPIFLLAARDDEIVAPAQLFAAGKLVGTPRRNVRRAVAACRHVGLFMGRATLEDTWPTIVRWLDELPIAAPEHLEAHAIEPML